MDIADFLTPDRVALDVRSRDKGLLLAEAARLVCRSVPSLASAAIEAALRDREQLGSTGLGGGFALPHARIDTAKDYTGLFMRLAKPIDFAAIDDKPVDLVFVLLIPTDHETSHLKALAALSRKFRDTAEVAKIRKADTAASVYGLLTGA
jgi:PTS system nitrogen regulatory IIA component